MQLTKTLNFGVLMVLALLIGSCLPEDHLGNRPLIDDFTVPLDEIPIDVCTFFTDSLGNECFLECPTGQTEVPADQKSQTLGNLHK